MSSFNPGEEASWSILGSNISNVLEVGSTLPNSFLKFYTNSDPNKAYLIGASNLQTDNLFFIATQTGATTARVDFAMSNGFVGIGSSVVPTQRLQVANGNIWMSTSNALLWGPSSKVILDTNGMITAASILEELKTPFIKTQSTIYYTGSVGINTNAPGYELDVVGTVRATDITMSSDCRLKTDIKELSLETCKTLVRDLRPVEFAWKKDGAAQLGFIAQDLQETAGDYKDKLVKRAEDDLLSVNYIGLIAPLVKVIQDMQLRIKELEKKIQKD